MQLADTLARTAVNRGELAVFWLGQAGFLFKTADGTRITADPYLSDCVERHFGFKRLMPHLIKPEELQTDLLLISHAHYDHFDPDAVPAMLSGHTRLAAARDCRAECEALSLPAEQITYLACGDTYSYNGVQVTAVPCDHGELAPDALGLLLTVSGKRIYLTGDTAFRPDYFKDETLQNLDLLILPINGAFGNMNEEQAAKAAAILRPKLTVPCHFWNFAEHGGNPGLFADYMKDLAPELAYTLIPMGGYILL